MMPVLNKNTADALLREMTDGKAESEKIRLSDLLAKMQAAITHLALLSDFNMLRKLLGHARAMFPNDGHRANNDFAKFLSVLLGAYLAGVSRPKIVNAIEGRKSMHSGTGVVVEVRTDTNSLFGDKRNGGSKIFDDTVMAPSSEQLQGAATRAVVVTQGEETRAEVVTQAETTRAAVQAGFAVVVTQAQQSALASALPPAPSERFPDTVRPVFPVAALAERTVCCCWSRSLL